MTFEEKDLYPTIEDKAAALGFFIIQNHPCMDGNKRCGHAAMETFLVLNGKEIEAPVDEVEKIILEIASGKLFLKHFIIWLAGHIRTLTS
jgi:death-on-curing protein